MSRGVVVLSLIAGVSGKGNESEDLFWTPDGHKGIDVENSQLFCWIR